MPYSIYPPIGIARVGNSDEYFIGPEKPRTLGVEFDNQGREHVITNFKDNSHRIKKQGARFRIFETDLSGKVVPYTLPSDARIQWTVNVAQRKEAVVRHQDSPPQEPTLPTPITNPAPRTISPGAKSISNSLNPSVMQVKLDGGSFLKTAVSLGSLLLDSEQNLIFLGGSGDSDSPSGASLNHFYTNSDWYDDVCDGWVKATIHLANGTVIEDIEPAWVIVGPPNYAPEIPPIVTAYDVILQVALENNNMHAMLKSRGLFPAVRPTFEHDIFPILRKAILHQWVHDSRQVDGRHIHWSKISTNFANLANKSNDSLRKDVRHLVRRASLSLRNLRLTARQNHVLKEWENGNYDESWSGVPQPGTTITAEGLEHAALDACVGQGLFPGIEIGIIMKNPSIYTSPFRINPAIVNPGDMTALMAQPWQADFLKCHTRWWPSQRPDISGQSNLHWARGIGDHQDMVDKFGSLGFVRSTLNGAFGEVGRDPSLSVQPDNY